MKAINIAIDGYSSTGKSTLAKQLAARLAYRYVDTGAMYRAVTLAALEAKHLDDTEDWTDWLTELKLDFVFQAAEKQSALYLNGRNRERDLRFPAVADRVSEVASKSEVRRFLVAQQQAMAADKRVVMDGRDIGTVVLPQAELKIFMIADPEIRAHRRHQELLAKGISSALEEVRENLAKRDHMDSTRKDSPLRQAEDAKLLDNSHLSIAEQLQIAENWVQECLRN